MFNGIKTESFAVSVAAISKYNCDLEFRAMYRGLFTMQLKTCNVAFYEII